MRSSSCLAALAVALALGASSPSEAQQAQGFAVDRFYPSASGAGWLVMNALDMRGGLGGSLAMTIDYAKNPLTIEGGDQPLHVVSDLAVADLAGSITYDRFRFSMNVQTPIALLGQSGAVQGQFYSAPVVDLSTRTDLLQDLRVGAEARLVGAPDGRFRLGVGAQLYFPNGSPSDFVTDGTFRGMLRLLAAGDVGPLAYASQLGVHVRPRDDASSPEGPRGNEGLYGAALGGKFQVGKSGDWMAIVGPEIFGATALKSPSGATALEALISARMEGTRANAMQTRIKLGVGTGLTRGFGAPDLRVVLGVEVFSFQN